MAGNKKTFYLDFGKTVVETVNGKIIAPNQGCVGVVKKLINSGHNIVLNMRISYDSQNPAYKEAINYMASRGLFVPEQIGVSDKKLNPQPFDVKNEEIYL